MKSERRHELQHNELAEWLAKTMAAVKPYQNIVLGGVLVVLILVVGYTVWSRMQTSETSQAWDTVNAAIDAGNVTQLAQVVDDYPNTSAAYMAALVLADNYLGQGCKQLFVNKASAQDELNKAIRHYESVRQHSQATMIVERATYGLARAKEAKGELGEAERLYDEVATTWPEGTFGAAASRRLADLKRPATKELYDRFAHFDPKPAFSTPGERPAFDLNSLPDEGSASPPKATPTETENKDEQPKPGESPKESQTESPKPPAAKEPSKQ